MELGLVLKKCRVRAKMTQEQLAEKLHLARSSVSKVENGKQSLEAKLMINWIQATGATEVAVALFFGMDALTIVQQVLGMMVAFWLL